MINLKAKDFFIKANYWKSLIIRIFSIFLFIYIFFYFLYINLNSNINSIDHYGLNIVIVFCYFTFLSIFNKFFNFWLFKKCYSLMMKDVKKIQKTVELPKKLPKVVYVYTTHNDFWETRLLQSMQQTYKNIEYWISDGSSNKEKIQEIKDFCKKYNVNYHSLNRPSLNKADNLNHFLKYAKVDFDYLLISDADVAIDKNFVSTSLKFFYYNGFKRLGWVSSLLNNYWYDNWYSYISCYYWNNVYFYRLEPNFNQQKSASLHSACSLIKKELLLDFDMKFPDSNLEDFWLEFLATRKYWKGFLNPITISLEIYDKNIFNNFTRMFRINDWSVKLYKDHYWTNLNESNKLINQEFFNTIWIRPLKWIFLPILSSLIIFIFINYSNIITSHYQYLIIISCILSWIIFDFIYKIIKNLNLWNWKKFHLVLLSLLIYYLYNISTFWYSSMRFFNSFFRSKYADFITSKNISKNSKLNNLYKMRKFIITFFSCLIILTIFDIIFIFFKWNALNFVLMFVFIYVNLLLSWILLSLISFFILYSLSWINKKTNNSKKFIYCQNEKMFGKK